MKQYDLKSAYILTHGRNGPVHQPVTLPADLQRIDAQTDVTTLRARVAEALGHTRPEDLHVTYGDVVSVENGKVVRIPALQMHRKDRSGAAVWQLAA